MKAIHVSVALGAILLSAALTRAQDDVLACRGNTGVDFQIVTDRSVYAPKSMMHVKFLVTNTDYTERQDSSTGSYGFSTLYLDRGLSYCTSPLGSYWLTVLDKNNKEVPINGCSSDVLMEKVDAVELFTNPKTGIALTPGEVFGREAEFELPAKRGRYHLKTELFTGDFNQKQLRTLAEKHMRVLPPRCNITAPVVSITVK